MKVASRPWAGTVVLECTGREFHCHGGIVGIDAQGRVTDGYDSEFAAVKPLHEDDDEAPRFTEAEREELAGAMIARWTLFARNGEPKR